ncbi:MAG: sulfatase-like hydrolase/transferase [Acidimicrobiia bacterium]|jgi:hypothetical protein
MGSAVAPMRRRLAAITGLSAVAFVAPVLDLYGRNPEVFVANRTSTTEIVLFALGAALLVPVLSWGVLALARLVGGRAEEIAYQVIVALLSFATGFVVARQIQPDSTVWAILLALAVGAGVFWLVRSIDTVFVVAAVAVPVLVFMFLATSATAALIWSEPDPEPESAADATPIGSPHHLVMLQLDEMPLSSIMDLDGTINEALFPNFARLATEGTWYRNALSDSIATTQSVPAILTGVKDPERESPSYAEHPDNLFTLVDGTYEMHVIEWVAELCPEDVCPDYAGRAPARFTNLLKDVGVVYGHLTLPGSMRESLPSIDNSWKGFLGQAETPSGTGVEIEGLPVPPDPDREDWVNWVQRLINGIEGGTDPTLSYAHLRAPHVPWVVNPSGTHYERPEQYTEVEGVEGDGRWGPDPIPPLRAFQRHLYQIGFLDVMLGRLLDHLEDTGTWDDTMVVVVADHGASFVTGEHRRWPYDDNRDDLYRVPLFIKYPGQTVGATVDLPAFGIDILPTMVDVLDIDTDWEFDGQSLLDLEADRPHEPLRWCCNGEGASTDLDVLYQQVERNHDWVPDQSSWAGVAGVGPHADLVGRPIESLQVEGDDGFRWSLQLGESLAEVDRSSGMVQTYLTGRVELREPPGSEEMLIAVNDTIAGVAFLSLESASTGTVSGVITEDLVRDGGNEVELLLSDGNGGWMAGGSDDLSLELVADDGHVIEIGAEGNKRLQVDEVTRTDEGWELKGWAVDISAEATPEKFYVFAGDRLLFSGPPNAENANVVRWFESEELLESGFEIVIPSEQIDENAVSLLVVAEFADRAVADQASIRR